MEACQYAGMFDPMVRPVVLLSERRNTISTRVHARIHEAIVTTEFKPGTRISEADLAEALSVSRTPVREAFVRLFEEGLIEVSPQTGTRVSLINPERVRQAVFVRSSIECAALRQHAQAPTSGQMRDLALSIEAQERGIADGDFTRMHAQDMSFHAQLMAAFGHPLAWNACQFVSADMTRIGFLIGLDERHLRQIVHEHRGILTEIGKGDFEAAATALNTHIHSVEIDQSMISGKNSAYFDAPKGAG
jgi:DNA-binding GntR family transcriptional regulator